ncbi:MAG: STAS domain-containing protein [Terracidiphilus sp.]
MPLSLEQHEESSLLSLEGTIDIACAADLKQLLIQALSGAKAVRVSLQKVSDLDVTAVQLLWAAAREARTSGLEFALAGTVPESVLKTLASAGFHEFPVSQGIS